MFNKFLFSNILTKINNAYDSMTEFGEKANLDRSYISKYINQKLENPPSPEILKKISNASNGVTSYYELMEICGYIDLSSVFLLNDGFETNLCYWNKEDLQDIGFSSEDIEQLLHLSNNKNIQNRYSQISDILNKYSEDILNVFYQKAVGQTNLLKEQNQNYDIKEKIIELFKKNEATITQSITKSILEKIGPISSLYTGTTKIPILRNRESRI